MTNEINELRREAKSLGVNSLGKSADAIRAEIAQKQKGAEKQIDEDIQPDARNDRSPRRNLAHAGARAKAEEIRKQRRERGYDLNALNYRLAVDKREDGYAYRWCNDTYGNLQRMEARGWERAPNEEPRLVDKKTGLKAYLMRIPQEIYDEDFEAKQAPIDEVEREILEGVTKDNEAIGSKFRAGSAKITHRTER